MKKNNKIIIILAVVILISVICIVLLLNKDDKEKDPKNSSVIPEEVVKLYNNLSDINCFNTLTYSFEEGKNSLTADQLGDEQMLNLIFRNLEIDGKLEDNITMDDYKIAVKKVFGDIDFYPKAFKDFSYKKYVYGLRNEVFTRNTSTCKDGSTYINHMYGYSFEKKEIIVDLNICLLKDNKLYKLDNTFVSDYDANEKDEQLLKCSGYRYNYTKEDNVYALKSIEELTMTQK